MKSSSCEFSFSFSGLQPNRNGVVYQGTRFYNGHQALRVKRWLHLVAEDASGLTFEEWDTTKDIDNSQPPVPMIINSIELGGAGFNLWEWQQLWRGSDQSSGLHLRALRKEAHFNLKWSSEWLGCAAQVPVMPGC